MKRLRYMQGGWIILLIALLFGMVVVPVGATSRAAQRVAQQQSSTSLNTNVYITTASLAPIFQTRINQRVPVAVNAAISNMLSKLPARDQGWALLMANTLIQPSAELVGLSPQQNGLATAIRISLYAGDPKAITGTMLISFSVANSSTLQVSAAPVNGSPALASGPLATLQIPFGQLNSVATTPNCGDAAMGLNLQVPVALGQAQANTSGVNAQQLALHAPVNGARSVSATQPENSNAGGISAYVEIPASSLATVGGSIGSLPVSGSITANNIQVGVQGSDLLVTSDILWGSFPIGTAVTTLAPTASGGNLVVHVLNTTLNVLQIFTIPYNTYNQQVEQSLNAKLGKALAGKFYVTQAAIGTNAHVPCTAPNSLVLTGITSLGG